MRHVLIFAFIATLIKAQVAVGSDVKCLPEHPHFSAGDLNLTKANYDTFKAQHRVFVLGLSDSDCETCCYMESMLHHLKVLLSSNHTYKGKSVPVVRIDVKAARGSFAEDLPSVNYFPKILIYKEGKYYLYSGYLHYPLILHFFSRVLYPSVRLNTTEEVNKFLDTEREWPDWSPFYDYGKKYEEVGRDKFPKRLVRAVAFISSREDYRQEIGEIRDALQRLSPREDFRFAFVYNKDTIAAVKSLHPAWFSEYSRSSVVLQRRPNNTVVFDLAADNTNYFYWLTE